MKNALVMMAVVLGAVVAQANEPAVAPATAPATTSAAAPATTTAPSEAPVKKGHGKHGKHMKKADKM